jgi:hypothetical protein
MDPIMAARFLSIPTAFMMTGYAISASQSTLPLIYDQPASVSLKIFKGVYDRGAVLVVPSVILSATATAYLAYANPAQRKALGFATAVTLSWLPFTTLVMFKGIGRLLELGGSAIEMEKAERSGEILTLLKAWAFQNAVRGMFAFVGGSITLWASLAK